MSDGRLNADVEQYLRAAAMNAEPPPIISDQLVDGGSPIEQLLQMLGLAANEGDPADNADSLDGYAERDARTAEAAEGFAAQDEQAAAQLAQQIPQLASGIAGSLAGTLGTVLAPLTQIPQQIAQGAQQVLQAGLGLVQQTGGELAPGAGAAEDLAAGEFDHPDEWGDIGDFGDPGGSFDDDGLGDGGLADSAGFGGGPGAAPPATTPAAMLGPPAIPSAATTPSSATSRPPAPAPAAVTAPSSGSGMAGVPMVPPGAVPGGTGTDRDVKADTRRVSVPPVRNGAPVQGRLTTPPGAPTVTRKVEGKPVATRRIALSSDPDDPERR